MNFTTENSPNRNERKKQRLNETEQPKKSETKNIMGHRKMEGRLKK